MLRLHRAFIRETLTNCGAMAAILLSIFIVTRVLLLLRRSAGGELPLDAVLTLAGLGLMRYSDILLPVIVYLSMLAVISRWQRDRELLVVNACGRSLAAMLRPTLWMGFCLMAVTAALSLYLVPLSNERAYQYRLEMRERLDWNALQVGQFQTLPRQQTSYFIRDIDSDNGDYLDIFMYRSVRAEGTTILTAERGRQIWHDEQQRHLLILERGSRYHRPHHEEDYTQLEFATYGLHVEQRPPPPVVGLPMEARPLAALIGNPHPVRVAELHWRFSKALMPMVLVLYALFLPAAAYRTPRVPSMFWAIVLYFAYSNLLGIGMGLVSRGRVSPEVGLWGVHGVLFVGAVVFGYLRIRRQALN